MEDVNTENNEELWRIIREAPRMTEGYKPNVLYLHPTHYPDFLEVLERENNDRPNSL